MPGYEHVIDYTYPANFDSLEKVEGWARDIWKELSEAQHGFAEDLELTLSQKAYFKTITGITNDVVADQQEDTLTLAATGGVLTIVGTAATDTITFDWTHLGIESLADPGADRMAFWDDGETAMKWLAPDGTTIEISGTTLQVLAGGLDHGTLSGLADDDHTHYSLRNKGIISGCVVSDATGLDVDWTAGSIYDYDNTAVRTIASASAQAVSNNSVNYVYFDPGTSVTVLQISTTRPTDSDQVLVATVCAQDGDIVGILNEDIIGKRVGEVELALHEMFPIVVISGGLVSAYTDDATSDLDVIMDAIVFIAGGHHRYSFAAINSEDNIMTTHFHDASNNWDSGTANDIDTDNYDDVDDSAGPIAIPAAKWVKGMFYFSLGAINYVYPTTYYTTQAQALGAPLPATPPGLERCVPLTAIVFQKGETDINDATFLDIRPGLGETSQSPITDHGSLAGLSVDDHLQYIKDSEFTQDSGVLVGTGAGTFAEETGDTLRTSLGLAIGSDVQAWDADLDTYAGITPSADIQTFLANADFAAMMADLSGTAGAAFAWNSQNLTGVGTIGCGNVTGGTYNGVTLAVGVTSFTVAGGSSVSKLLTVDDNFVVSTQLTAIGANTTHRGSVGTDHGYIDQDLQVSASPTFVSEVLDQATADGVILSLLSTGDVDHGMTNYGDTAQYASFQKASSTSGGISMYGFSEGNFAIANIGFTTTCNTTKTVSGLASCLFYGAKKSGTGVGDVDADANILGVRARRTGAWKTVFIVDEDGDLYYEGALVPYDRYDDCSLVKDTQSILTGKLGEFIQYNEADLVRIGILGAPLKDGGLVSHKNMTALLLGAISQLSKKVGLLESKVKRLT